MRELGISTLKIREAAFALQIVRRHAGDAAILYRRMLTARHEERFTRIVAISPLAYSAGIQLLRAAVRTTAGPAAKLTSGPFLPLDDDWGARVGCYALVAAGLRNADRLHKAATNLQHADGTEAAWWLGAMGNGSRRRAVRALRILVEAVR
jgi:hypothetical protein